MRNPAVFLALIAFLVLNTLASEDVISCLSSNDAASSYCTVMLNGLLYLNTGTVSTATKVVTAELDAAQVTVTSTVIETDYTTQGPTSTISITSVTSTVIETTITTYVSRGQADKRAASSCDTSSALSALSDLGVSDLSTACASIDAVPTPTTLSTGAVVSLTVTQEPEPTITTTITGVVRYTVAPSTIISTTVTSSYTRTSTVTLAAPTFTQVWGPQAGCVDLNQNTNESLDPRVTMPDAVSTCQAHCAQNPKCSFVFVQLSFENYGPGIKPFYQCHYNNHTLDEATDIQCGKTTKIWGPASGFNAIKRGL